MLFLLSFMAAELSSDGRCPKCVSENKKPQRK
jgi:hypothetical protein